MTPAEELRAAAHRLCALAADATPGPWVPEHPEERWEAYRDTVIIGGGKPIATANSEYGGPLNAAYIAAMHPRTGAALANWLATTADQLAALTHPDWQDVVAPHALAVARAINQEQQ